MYRRYSRETASEYTSSGRRNFFSPIVERKIEKAAEYRSKDHFTLNDRDVPMKYDDYLDIGKEYGWDVEEINYHWSKESNKVIEEEKVVKVENKEFINRNVAHLADIVKGKSIAEKIENMEIDNEVQTAIFNSVQASVPQNLELGIDDVLKTESYNRMLVNVLNSNEAVGLKSQAIEEIIINYTEDKLDAKELRGVINIDNEYKKFFADEEVNLYSYDIIQKDYAFKIKKNLHSKHKHDHSRYLLEFDDGFKIHSKSSVESAKDEIDIMLLEDPDNVENFEKSFFFMRKQFVVPRLKAVLIPSGGGKSYIFKRKSKFFVDVDYLRRLFNNDDLFEIIIYYCKVTNRWNLLNKLWQFVIYTYFDLINDRIVLCHSKFQLPDVLNDNIQVFGLIPDLDESYNVRFFKQNKISIMNEVDYVITDRKNFMYYIFRKFYDFGKVFYSGNYLEVSEYRKAFD